MKKLSIIIFTIAILPMFLISCQSVKDGLSGTKRENSDEFLVQKKNPLVMPPDFMRLPEPKNITSVNQNKILEEETDIQKILEINEDTSETTERKFGKVEEFILEKIKK